MKKNKFSEKSKKKYLAFSSILIILALGGVVLLLENSLPDNFNAFVIQKSPVLSKEKILGDRKESNINNPTDENEAIAETTKNEHTSEDLSEDNHEESESLHNYNKSTENAKKETKSNKSIKQQDNMPPTTVETKPATTPDVVKKPEESPIKELPKEAPKKELANVQENEGKHENENKQENNSNKDTVKEEKQDNTKISKENTKKTEEPKQSNSTQQNTQHK